MRNSLGHGKDDVYKIGHVRIRTRHKRNGERRAYVKVSANPSHWVLLSKFVWEEANGRVPDGMCIHHTDGNKLNDEIENLELVSKSEHMTIHRPEFDHKRIARSVAARRKLKWSTKSVVKRTGRHPNGCGCEIHQR